jgi:glycine/D-amino acid oxidase-like deaminating enzyme
VSEVAGYYLASELKGAGIGLALITGCLIAYWIIGKRMPDLAKVTLPDRFDLS